MFEYAVDETNTNLDQDMVAGLDENVPVTIPSRVARNSRDSSHDSLSADDSLT